MNDSFVFYSKSSNKEPGKYSGKGWSEHVGNEKKYKNLSKIHDWRKKLSNMYVCPFKLDGHTWNSVEHYFHSVKYRNKHDNYYRTFSTKGGKQWSLDPFKSKQAGKAGRLSKAGRVYRNAKLGVPTDVSMHDNFYSDNIHWKAMTLALLAKFTQCPTLKNLLLSTRDAELYHLVTERGKKSQLQRWDHLERIRFCIRKYEDYDLSVVSNLPKDLINNVLK